MKEQPEQQYVVVSNGYVSPPMKLSGSTVTVSPDKKTFELRFEQIRDNTVKTFEMDLGDKQ